MLRYKQNVRLAKDPAGIHIYFESLPIYCLIKHDISFKKLTLILYIILNKKKWIIIYNIIITLYIVENPPRNAPKLNVSEDIISFII